MNRNEKTLLYSVYFASSLITQAQYTKILDLNDFLGSHPLGSLIYDGTFLYGMTSDGGSGASSLYGDCGVIF